MLYYVCGEVTVLEPGLAVIDCGGVGYGCHITGYTAAQLKLGQKAKLFITESIREDAHDLYGFISKEEQRCYELLTAAQGVGKKIAQRIILELKDKIGGGNMELDFSAGPAVTAPAQSSGHKMMAHAALQELGYTPIEIRAALQDVDPNATTEEMVRHALRAMVMKG